jgi:hypothetical protein
MSFCEYPKSNLSVAQLNSELHHAQLELLSAQCATDQMRFRFSVKDLARYGQRDLLRKAIDAASLLRDYYCAIERELLGRSSGAENGVPEVTEEQIKEATAALAGYLSQQREHYRPSGIPLSRTLMTMMEPFFSPAILEQARIVKLKGDRIPAPPIFEEAKALGFENLPEITHMASVTFGDVVVFHEKVEARRLFHGLVHVVQFEVLGPERYAELYVRGFLRAHSNFTVALEAHAYALDSKFAGWDEGPFSVDQEVRLWADEGRY